MLNPAGEEENETTTFVFISKYANKATNAHLMPLVEIWVAPMKRVTTDR